MTVSPNRRATGLFTIFLVAVVVAGVFVARSAQTAVLESQSGSVSEIILDPNAAGFRAFTDATPTALVIHTAVSATGAELLGATILTPADEGSGGTVVTVPATTVAVEQDRPLADVFASEGLDATVDRLAELIGAGFSDVVVLDASSWTSLMREDLPLQLTLATDLVEPDGDNTTVILGAGTSDYQLLDVARIASHRNPSEPLLGVALRQQEIWRSWISRTAGADERPDLFELETGFSGVIGALASGEVSYRVIPTTTASQEPPEATQYLANVADVRELFAAIVPFPEPVVPGDRPSVLLLDSTLGELDRVQFVQAITLAGGRVTILGNTDGGGETVNRVQVHDEAGAELAAALADQLGAGEPEQVPLVDATTSVTVIMAEPLDGP